jgi:Zn-finger nucleic acid-binding protein
MNCVRCDLSLEPHLYEGVEIDRCPKCNGSWLDAGELTKIIETRDVMVAPDVIQETLGLAFKGTREGEVRSPERCPKCRKVMLAVNYDYSSGIMLDRCPDDHGLWLDGDELLKVQGHREHWDQQAAENQGDWAAFARAVNERRADGADEMRRRDMRPTKYLVNTLIRRFLGG